MVLIDNDIYDMMNIQYDEQTTNNTSELRRSNITKDILLNILVREDTGISHGDLANIINIDRKNLRKYTKELIDKKLIVRDGKRGKYYPATRLHKNKDVLAELLVKLYTKKIFSKEDFFVDSPDYFIYFEKAFQQKIRENQKDYVKDMLFNFSNKIGSLITYLLIESINQENELTKGIKDTEIINLRLKRWLDDAVSSIIPVLHPLFKEQIISNLDCITNKCLKNRNSKDQLGLQYYLEFLVLAPYLLDKECVDELKSKFFSVYPSLEEPIKQIKSNIPKLIKKKVEDNKEILRKIQRQKECKHCFVKHYNPYIDREVFRCNKCEKYKKGY